jgi:multidrug resistance protein, MATE family
VRMGLWTALAYGILALPLLLAVDPVLRGLGQDPAISAIAHDYMVAACFGMVPALVFTVFRSFLGAINLAGILLWATIGGVLLNAGLNWILIFGNLGVPQLGVQGAAIASVFTNLAMALSVAIFATRHNIAAGFEIFVRFWRPDWAVLKTSLALGLPISLTMVAETAMFQASSLMAGALGVVPLAAHSIVMQMVSFAFMVPYGLSHAATVRVCQEIGAGKLADGKRAAETALLAAIAASFMTVIMFVAFPEPLIRIFLPVADPLFAQTLATAVPLLLIAAAFNLFDGTQAVAAGNLRGIKDTQVPMWIAIASYWGLGIPAGWLLAFTFGFGVPGVWVGLAIGVFATSILLNLRFFVRLGRTIASAADSVAQPSPAS